MKKPSSKIIVTILVSLCLIALAGAYFLTREPQAEFVPAAAEKPSGTDSWEEKTEPAPAGTLKDTAESAQVSGTPEDETQVTVSEDETGSVTNLTGGSPGASRPTEKPTEKPAATEDSTNPEAPPAYDESVPQAEPEEPATTTPTAPTEDSGSHEGEVFVPGFGWIPKSGPTQHDVIDSDGDINKQVGTMGGS